MVDQARIARVEKAQRREEEAGGCRPVGSGSPTFGEDPGAPPNGGGGSTNFWAWGKQKSGHPNFWDQLFVQPGESQLGSQLGKMAGDDLRVPKWTQKMSGGLVPCDVRGHFARRRWFACP